MRAIARSSYSPTGMGFESRSSSRCAGSRSTSRPAWSTWRDSRTVLPSTHPIRGPELRALRELRREYPESPYLFVTERGGPMTPATARKLIARAGELAKLPFPIHPHMLRHSAGYKLANEGHDTRSIQQYLGHRNITHTVRYTELSPERFKGFWKD